MTADTEIETARTGTEVARWLLPLLKEYTDKLNAVSESLPAVSGMVDVTAARLLAMRETHKKFLLEYSRLSSELLDHHHFDDEDLKAELANRWQEAEMAIRVSDLLGPTVQANMNPKNRQRLRQFIDHILNGALLE